MSDRMESTEKERIEETEKIDIISLAGDFLYGLKKLWLLILAAIPILLSMWLLPLCR